MAASFENKEEVIARSFGLVRRKSDDKIIFRGIIEEIRETDVTLSTKGKPRRRFSFDEVSIVAMSLNKGRVDIDCGRGLQAPLVYLGYNLKRGLLVFLREDGSIALIDQSRIQDICLREETHCGWNTYDEQGHLVPFRYSGLGPSASRVVAVTSVYRIAGSKGPDLEIPVVGIVPPPPPPPKPS